MGLETISKVENTLIGLIKARYLLQYAHKFFRDHWKFFCGAKDCFESAPKGLRRIEN